MAAVHGSNVAVLADEFDFTTYFNQLSLTKSIQVVDDTRFSLDDRTYISGPGEGSISLQGPWDTQASGLGLSDNVLDAAIGTDTIFTVGVPGVATVGGPCLMLQALEAGYQIRATVNDAVRITVNATGNGGVRVNGKILQDLSVETTTFNGVAVDNTTNSLSGGVGHLHVTAFSGTSGTLKIQHSPDNSVWADLITFTSVTAVTSQRTVVTGTVDRYLRFAITADVFTSMTVAAAFARYRRS